MKWIGVKQVILSLEETCIVKQNVMKRIFSETGKIEFLETNKTSTRLDLTIP